MTHFLNLLIILVVSACGLSKQSQSLAKSDNDSLNAADIESLYCVDGGKKLFSVEDDSIYLLDAKNRWVGSRHELLQGEFSGATWSGDNLHINGVFSLSRFELIYTATVHLRRNLVEINIHDAKTGERFDHFFSCELLTINDQKFKYPHDKPAISVDQALLDVKIQNVVYNAIMEVGYMEDEGQERSIESGELSYRMTSITKDSIGNHLLGMFVNAKGNAYSGYDRKIMHWNCDISLFKALDRWFAEEAFCDIDAAEF